MHLIICWKPWWPAGLQRDIQLQNKKKVLNTMIKLYKISMGRNPLPLHKLDNFGPYFQLPTSEKANQQLHYFYLQCVKQIVEY